MLSCWHAENLKSAGKAFNTQLNLFSLNFCTLRGILEDTVLRHCRHRRVDILPLEGIIEAANSRDGSFFENVLLGHYVFLLSICAL